MVYKKKKSNIIQHFHLSIFGNIDILSYFLNLFVRGKKPQIRKDKSNYKIKSTTKVPKQNINTITKLCFLGENKNVNKEETEDTTKNIKYGI